MESSNTLGAEEAGRDVRRCAVCVIPTWLDTAGYSFLCSPSVSLDKFACKQIQNSHFAQMIP